MLRSPWHSAALALLVAPGLQAQFKIQGPAAVRLGQDARYKVEWKGQGTVPDFHWRVQEGQAGGTVMGQGAEAWYLAPAVAPAEGAVHLEASPLGLSGPGEVLAIQLFEPRMRNLKTLPGTRPIWAGRDDEAEADRFGANDLAAVPDLPGLPFRGLCLAVDSYHGTVQVMGPDGSLKPWVGSGRRKRYGEETKGDQVTFGELRGIAAQGVPAGDGYALEVALVEDHVIRLIDGKGRVSTLAGVSGEQGHRDGKADKALFAGPTGLAYVDGALYVADTSNRCIRKIFKGEATTLSGVPGAHDVIVDGEGTKATYFMPQGLAYDPGSGCLLVGDAGSCRKVALDNGAVETLAGNPKAELPCFKPWMEPGEHRLDRMKGVPCSGSITEIAVHGGKAYLMDGINACIFTLDLRPGTGRQGEWSVLAGYQNQEVYRTGKLIDGRRELAPGDCAALGAPRAMVFDAKGRCLVSSTSGESISGNLHISELQLEPEPQAEAPAARPAAEASLEHEAVASAAPPSEEAADHTGH